MKEHADKKALLDSLKDVLKIEKDGSAIEILNDKQLRSELIDEIIWNAAFSPSEEVRGLACFIVRLIGKKTGNGPASIFDIYKARGEGNIKGFTVPAINVRGLSYDFARAIFRAAKKDNVGLFIFEIARSESGYTGQKPAEFTAVMLAAAIKENYPYPIFIQGDHYQVNGKKYKEDAAKEMKGAKDLIKESIEAGYYNIDLDTSTLVDLSKKTIEEQQKLNYEIAAELTKYIRSIEPKGISIMLGGEIGEIGSANSNEPELRAYLGGYLNIIGNIPGISKMAVQTGTTHGGVPLPDGTIAKVKLDFDVLDKLGQICRKDYKISGCVQHGASTLPADLFDKFAKVETSEIHLATEFQNMIMDHPAFPEKLKKEIHDWCIANCASERKETDTELQFIYKARKKANGPFKKQMWSIPEADRTKIAASLEQKLSFLFDKLNVKNTVDIVKKYAKAVDVKVNPPVIGGKQEAFEGAD
ncbi:MAG: aldolase [Elusimicrobia bacterium RIFOXYB2_FULL_48_7]|nr:MAG: aldolase [Elusimicrobia bacterium RIFOXYB2_FULL_48_7]